MAAGKSGSLIFDGSANSIRLNWAEDYDANANTSVVRITSAELQSGAYYGTWYFNGNFAVNGSAVVYMSADSPTTHVANVSAAGSTWYTIQTASGTAPPWYSGTLYHNADGTLTIPISINMWAVRFSPDYVRSDFSGTQYVELTAIARPYTLTLSQAANTNLTVKRGGTTLSNGATVYTRDVLTITYSGAPGYDATAKLNGISINSGHTHTVTGAVTVATQAEAKGLVYIDNGSEFEAAQIFIDNGSEWEQHMPFIDNGTEFELYT